MLWRTEKSEVHDTAQPSDESHVGIPGHVRPRGASLQDETLSDVAGYDHDVMKARALLTYEEEKKLMRRVDWRLVPLCALIFMVKNVDANNAANARIMNQKTPRNILTQLNMTGDDYNWVSTIYFIPFIVFEIPSNLLLKRMLPSRWQSRIMVTWGITLACHAAVTTGSGLLVARFFLGLCEAGMFPGIILQFTYWYRADEMYVRLLAFYTLEFFANVVSALLAYAFDLLSGACGLSGWQWFFLIEGVVTIAFGIAIWFVLPDFPEQAKWLTEKEKAFLQARLPSNAPRSSESNFSWREILDTLKDIRLWLFTFVWIFKTVGTTGLAFYIPTIVASLGLSTPTKSQLLTIPASVLPILIIAVSTLLVDKFNVPNPLVSLVFLVGMLACYGVLYSYPNVGGVYAATTIAGGLSNAWFPLVWPWRLQTTSKATGSAFAIALTNSLGGIGSIVGPQIFRQQYAPEYHVPFAVAMGFIGLCFILSCVTWWVTRRTEQQTRDIRAHRLAAARQGGQIMDDVDIEADFEKSKKCSR